jgi:hypothetical protein
MTPVTHTVHFPDGSTLEFASGDQYAGPGNCYSRQQVNTTCSWLRRPGGPWVRTGQRSLHRSIRSAEQYPTADQAWEAVAETPEEVPGGR